MMCIADRNQDNVVNQRVLSKLLTKAGWTVYVANHGVEALEILRQSTFWAGGTEVSDSSQHAGHAALPASNEADKGEGSFASTLEIRVVLMDQEMPLMDGLECTKIIRDWQSQGRLNAHVPIIGVTANARLEQINGLLAAGMDDVVSKPFRILELLPKIEELAKRDFG
jgi:CheY-like chemotaxis protein